MMVEYIRKLTRAPAIADRSGGGAAVMRSENEITQKEETKMTENALMLAGYDLSELTPEEQKQLMEMYKKELQVSQEGIDLQPIRFKINKDSCTFLDPFGNGHSEIRGVIVYKHKMRGYWDRTRRYHPRVQLLGRRPSLMASRVHPVPTTPGVRVDEAGNRTVKACKCAACLSPWGLSPASDFAATH